ncbi:DUF6642 family protein [Serinicoccus hydrothermalis]|uniref:DUF6642 family protein n=1 Tax=Serinicoccus hydrothermalis TaxID=1758689 RepID=UPI0012F95B62|nr:hypothetical protein [Serinicoccus hydrothermalis]
MRTVKPVLQALEHTGQVRTTHQSINRPEDIFDSFRRWGQNQHAGFTVGYLALHGTPGSVYVGRRKVGLVDLGEQLRAAGTKLPGRTLHLGSCAVLEDEDAVTTFRRAVGLKAITGFTEDVDWLESLAFELLLLDVLTYYRRVDAVERYIENNHKEFAKRLGFTLLRN